MASVATGRPRAEHGPSAHDALLNDGGAWRSAWALQQLSATELDSRIALLEDAARAYRAERESRTTRPDALSKLSGNGQEILCVQLCNVPFSELSAVENTQWEMKRARAEGR